MIKYLFALNKVFGQTSLTALKALSKQLERDCDCEVQKGFFLPFVGLYLQVPPIQNCSRTCFCYKQNADTCSSN